MIARTESVDEALDSESLGKIVRQAVIDAISGKEFEEAGDSDDLVIVGPNASATVKAAAAKAAMELVGRSAILAAPLADLERRLRLALAEAKAMAAEARRLGASIGADAEGAAAPERTTPPEPEASLASEPEPVAHESAAPALLGSDPAPGPAPQAPVAETPVPEVHDPEPEPAGPSQDSKSEFEPVPPGFQLVVCGERIPFPDRAARGFAAFMRDLVEALEKGPIKPAEACVIAKRNGYEAGRTTIAFQVGKYLGKRMVKWQEGKERWWGLQR